jgi:hypothetical protein
MKICSLSIGFMVGDWLHGELYPHTLHYDHSGRDVKAEANHRDNQREEGDAYP